MEESGNCHASPRGPSRVRRKEWEEKGGGKGRQSREQTLMATEGELKANFLKYLVNGVKSVACLDWTSVE